MSEQILPIYSNNEEIRQKRKEMYFSRLKAIYPNVQDIIDKKSYDLIKSELAKKKS